MQNSGQGANDHHDESYQEHEDGYPVNAVHHLQVIVPLLYILLTESDVRQYFAENAHRIE
jgi:hypothetical protein